MTNPLSGSRILSWGGGVGQKLIQSSKLSATDKQTKQD